MGYISVIIERSLTSVMDDIGRGVIMKSMMLAFSRARHLHRVVHVWGIVKGNCVIQRNSYMGSNIGLNYNTCIFSQLCVSI